MFRTLTTLAAVLLISTAADAQCISTWSKDCDDSRGTYGQGFGRSDGYDVRGRGSPDDRGPRVSPYSPNNRGSLYEQQPTFGDPDRYRTTDPRRCTGLLCD